jgi:hypothetical protein
MPVTLVCGSLLKALFIKPDVSCTCIYYRPWTTEENRLVEVGYRGQDVISLSNSVASLLNTMGFRKGERRIVRTE